MYPGKPATHKTYTHLLLNMGKPADVSLYEYIVSLLFGLFMMTILILSTWSLVLLKIGKTSGGGPLGYIAKVLLTSFA